jgi:predicted DNA-binding transcriptional regulator AlpA
MHTQKKTLSPRDVEQEFGFAIRTLEKWRGESKGPPWIQTGRLVRYRRTDIEAWLDANTIRPKGGGPAIN